MNIVLLNLVTVSFSLAYSLFLARTFGVGDEIEAYFAVSGLYLSTLHLLQTGSLTAIFVPKYHRLKETRGSGAAYELITVVMNWLLLVAVLLVALGIIFRSNLIDLRVPGFGESKQLICEKLLIWLMPLIVLDTFSAFIRCIIYAEKIYFKPEFVHSFSVVAQLLVVWLLSDMLGIQALIIGLYISTITRLLGLYVIVFAQEYTYKLKFRSKYFNLSELYSGIGLTTLYSIATQSFLFALDAALSALPRGKFAIFYYYKKIFSLTQGLMMKPINIIFFNQFSSDYNRGENTSKLKESSLTLVLFLVSVAAIMANTLLVDVLLFFFKNSEFTPDNVRLVCNLFSLSIIILLINLYQQFLLKIVMVTGSVSRLYKTLIICQIITVVFIISSTSIMSLSMAVGIMAFNGCAILGAGVWLTFKYSKENFCFFRITDLIRYTIFSISVIVISMCTSGVLKSYLNDGILVLTVKSLVVMIVGSLSAYIFKIKEISSVFFLIKSKLTKMC